MVSIIGPPASSHAYNSWSARARALVSGRCTEPLERVSRLERRLHRLGALTEASQRLTLSIGRQDPEPDSDPVRERDVAQPARRFACHVLPMRCLAANHAAERDDRIEPLAGGGRFGDDGQLECPWPPCDVDVGIRNAGAPQRVARPLEQFGRDVFVESADDDGDPPLTVGGARSGGGSFVRHDQCVRKWPSLSRFTSRYVRFSSDGAGTIGSRSTISRPYPSRPTSFIGLLVSTRMDESPRSSRISAP